MFHMSKFSNNSNSLNVFMFSNVSNSLNMSKFSNVSNSLNVQKSIAYVFQCDQVFQEMLSHLKFISLIEGSLVALFCQDRRRGKIPLLTPPTSKV